MPVARQPNLRLSRDSARIPASWIYYFFWGVEGGGQRGLAAFCSRLPSPGPRYRIELSRESPRGILGLARVDKRRLAAAPIPKAADTMGKKKQPQRTDRQQEI